MILCQRTRCQQDPVSAGPANIQPTKWKVFVKLPGGALQKEDKSDHTKYDGDFKNVDDEKAMGSDHMANHDGKNKPEELVLRQLWLKFGSSL